MKFITWLSLLGVALLVYGCATARDETTTTTTTHETAVGGGAMSQQMSATHGSSIDNELAADPSVLALDFRLRSPSPDGNPVDHPAYEAETDALVKAVINAAKKCPVILPRTVHVDSDGSVTIESAVYDAHQIPKDG